MLKSYFSNDVTYLPSQVYLIHFIYQSTTLRKKSPHSELFWSVCISPYSVRMRENPGKMRTRITPNTNSFYTVQIIHFVIHFHLIHFIDHGLPHSHSTYLVILILHRILALLSLSFFNQSRLWKLWVSLDKVFISNTYCIIWSWTPMNYYSLLLYKNHNGCFPLNLLHICRIPFPKDTSRWLPLHLRFNGFTDGLSLKKRLPLNLCNKDLLILCFLNFTIYILPKKE